MIGGQTVNNSEDWQSIKGGVRTLNNKGDRQSIISGTDFNNRGDVQSIIGGTDSQYSGDWQSLQEEQTVSTGGTDDCNKDGANSAQLLRRVAMF